MRLTDYLKSVRATQGLRPAYHSGYLWRQKISAYGVLAWNLVGGGRRSGCNFILGCGRSGTSILGSSLGLHPDVSYLFEPYARWAVVDPETDIWQTIRRGPSRAVLDASDVDERSRGRYETLFRSSRGTSVLVEKTPVNSLRLGFLDSLDPTARYVHILRDGVDVARSAAEWAREEEAMLGGRSHNLWWGVDRAKWRALLFDGVELGYFPEEVGSLTSDEEQVAYEWLMSLGEVDKWRDIFKDRFIEVRYDELTETPRVVLAKVADHLGLSASEAWLDAAAAEIRTGRVRSAEEIELPARMATAFNERQQVLGFPGRAVGRS